MGLTFNFIAIRCIYVPLKMQIVLAIAQYAKSKSLEIIGAKQLNV